LPARAAIAVLSTTVTKEEAKRRIDHEAGCRLPAVVGPRATLCASDGTPSPVPMPPRRRLNVNADVRNVVANSATFAHRHQ
jgi:hypothetical protein